ncbi:MAG: hypothetical protein IJ192_03960 [Clostridia bacterium]|nr:hypothetical protein [Clostridia bacterium]
MPDKSKYLPCPFCGSEKLSFGVTFFGGLKCISCKDCKTQVVFPFANWEDCETSYNRRTEVKRNDSND